MVVADVPQEAVVEQDAPEASQGRVVDRQAGDAGEDLLARLQCGQRHPHEREDAVDDEEGQEDVGDRVAEDPLLLHVDQPTISSLRLRRIL